MTKPTRFVGLHSHSTFSTFDAIGRPQDHIDFVIRNGGDALALTDHGNMNGFSHQYVHAEKLKKAGKTFKAIYGLEAYFVPSLTDWKALHEASLAAGAQARKDKKKAAEKPEDVGNELAQAEAELQEIADAKAIELEEDAGGTIVEDENESKSNKVKDPIKKAPAHLVLLAKNSRGLKSLFRLVSDSAAEGSFNGYPRMDLKMLKQYAQGDIIALTACVAGQLAKVIFNHQTEQDWNLWGPNQDKFEEIQADLAHYILGFQDALGKENYYLEIQFNKLGAQHLVNQHLIEASKRTGAPLVVTCDAHYSDPAHWRDREIYKLMNPKFMKNQEDNAKKIPQRIEELKCELYPKNAEQVWDTYKEFSDLYDFYNDDQVREAIERTHDIAHLQIGDVQPDRSVKLPAIDRIIEKNELIRLQEELNGETDEDTLAFKEVKKLAIEGLKFRRVAHKQTYIDRLKYELEVIKTLKFAKYFLTYYHIMRVVGEHMLIGNARGSAGGSLLAYVLGITQMDPIKHDLLFERFMTRKKKAFPDIDSDFSDRDQAVKLLQEFFGEENVIPVSNFAALKPLSLIKDLSKLNNIPFDVVNSYTTNMTSEVMSEKKKEPGFDAAQFEMTFEELASGSPSFNKFMDEVGSKVPGFRDTLNTLFKQQRTVGRHAGGVIITQNSRENMPLIKAKGGLQTPWPEGLAARHLEDFGLLKFDILAIATLRVFENCIRRILKKEGNKYPSFPDIRKFFFEKLHPDNNSLADPKVFKNVYWEGRYAGIFQFVKDNVQNFMKKMKPTSVLDIAIATSIFRPGPMGLEIEMPDGRTVHGAQNVFLINRQNPDSIPYVHPVLKEVLGYTSGLLIFQEQLQLIVNQLSGMHLDDTDSIRKAFTKKDKSNAEKQKKEIAALGDKFVEDCAKHSGLSAEDSRTVWADFEKWTAYGFNKSHAMAYAITSYQCAWFLTYYPDEWIAAYLDFCSTDKGKSASGEDPKTEALLGAKALGYKFGKPDINLSEEEYVVREGRLLVPSFSAIKGVGKMALYEIQQHRPYRTPGDLIVNPDGTWRHSKFNKRAFSHLIKTGAFESMDLVGEGKTFLNYKHMHTVYIDHYDELKRIGARKKNNDVLGRLKEIIEATKAVDPNDWTLDEKMTISRELTGGVDMSLILTKDKAEYLAKAKIESIDSFEDPGQFYWAIVDGYQIKESKNGKAYMRLFFHGESGAKRNCMIWGIDPDSYENFLKNDIIVGQFSKDDFGFKAWPNKIRKLVDKA